MTAASVTLAGRAAAERNMLDACTIQRVISVITDDAGDATPVYADAPVYVGRCKIGGDRPYEQSPESGGATLTVQRFTLHLPHAAGPFEPGDVVTITASALQPHLVGNTYRVAGPDERSLQTSQRMFVDLVTR